MYLCVIITRGDSRIFSFLFVWMILYEDVDFWQEMGDKVQLVILVLLSWPCVSQTGSAGEYNDTLTYPVQPNTPNPHQKRVRVTRSWI